MYFYKVSFFFVKFLFPFLTCTTNNLIPSLIFVYLIRLILILLVWFLFLLCILSKIKRVNSARKSPRSISFLKILFSCQIWKIKIIGFWFFNLIGFTFFTKIIRLNTDITYKPWSFQNFNLRILIISQRLFYKWIDQIKIFLSNIITIIHRLFSFWIFFQISSKLYPKFIWFFNDFFIQNFINFALFNIFLVKITNFSESSHTATLSYFLFLFFTIL